MKSFEYSFWKDSMEKNLEIFFWVKFELKEDNQFETKISPILIKFDILSTIINQNRFFDKKKKKKEPGHIFLSNSLPSFETRSIEFRIVGDNLLGRSPWRRSSFSWPVVTRSPWVNVQGTSLVRVEEGKLY